MHERLDLRLDGAMDPEFPSSSPDCQSTPLSLGYNACSVWRIITSGHTYGPNGRSAGALSSAGLPCCPFWACVAFALRDALSRRHSQPRVDIIRDIAAPFDLTYRTDQAPDRAADLECISQPRYRGRQCHGNTVSYTARDRPFRTGVLNRSQMSGVASGSGRITTSRSHPICLKLREIRQKSGSVASIPDAIAIASSSRIYAVTAASAPR
jgi:hypothetical protein